MAYRKEFTVRVPVLPGDDEGILLWLLRESAENYASGYMLKVVEFSDLGQVALEDVAPLGIKQLGPAYAGCRFREFRVVAEREAVEAVNA